MVEGLFFELLQVAIGTRTEVSHMPSANEWRLLFELSKKQALTAIAFRGLCKLEDKCQFGNCVGIDKITYLKWLGLTGIIEQKNKQQSAICVSLCKDLAHMGLYSCILKGQSNLAYYPEELRNCRTPGDIDVWCGLMNPNGIDIRITQTEGNGILNERFHGQRGVIEWVLADCRLNGERIPTVNYHHVDWVYKGIKCEVHFRPSWMNCPWHNIRLQRWCKENEQWLASEYPGCESGESFYIPSLGFNVIYQLIHIYRHLFNEGIGLRQLVDYYFVLRAFHAEQDEMLRKLQWAETVMPSHDVMRTLTLFGLDKFSAAVMYVLKKVFAMPDVYMICSLDENRGKALLEEIMHAGNFGKYDTRNVISKNEGFIKRFIRRQKRFMRFLLLYPSEVIWGPYFSVKQRIWRIWHGWR